MRRELNAIVEAMHVAAWKEQLRRRVGSAPWRQTPMQYHNTIQYNAVPLCSTPMQYHGQVPLSLPAIILCRSFHTHACCLGTTICSMCPDHRYSKHLTSVTSRPLTHLRGRAHFEAIWRMAARALRP